MKEINKKWTILLFVATGMIYSCDSNGQKTSDGKKSPMPEQILEDFDTNKDGKLSLEEFTEKAPEQFAKMDKNEDGFLTLEELKVGKNRGHATPEKIMSDLDTNNDGSLSKLEARGPLKTDFEKIDSNNDEKITIEEIKAGMPKQKRKPKN